MIKDIQLSLKKEWFDLTKSGEKKEDYRELNEYWFKRLVYDYKKVFKYCIGSDWDEGLYINDGIHHILKSKRLMFGFNVYNRNIMTLGYPSKNFKERILVFEHAGIEIRDGKKEWGAVPGVEYFVIKHGEEIK